MGFWQHWQLLPVLCCVANSWAVDRNRFQGNKVNKARKRFSQWQGKVIVVNFWATWCTPCREEIPEFIEAQKKFGEQGLVIVGIAIDQLDKVKMFSKEFGINYPVLVGGMGTWSLLEATGNQQSALPYTIVLNRAGEIVDSYLGRINLKKLESQIVPLLKEQSGNRQS